MAEQSIIRKIKIEENEYEIDAKYWNGKETLKTINGKSLFGSGDISISTNITNTQLCVSYNELKGLRDGSLLIPGQQYRITDYVTTTSQENTRSAGHQFDIIVTALNENTLCEEAHAIQNQNVDYFDSCNLEAWKIWYCLDNDTSKFGWAKEYIQEYIPDLGNLYKFDSWVTAVAKVCDDQIDTFYKTTINEKFSHFGYLEDLSGITRLILYGRDLDGDIDNGLNTSTLYHYDGVYNVDGVDYDGWAQFYSNENGNFIYATDYYGNRIYTLTERIVYNGKIVDGKGVIYRMIDEWGNDCPYDFKNIMFKKWLYADGYGITTEDDADFATYCYTFSWEESQDEIMDASVVCNNGYVTSENGENKGVHGNVIGVSINGIDGYPRQELNSIVFLSTYKYREDNGFYDGCYSNTFGENCYNNIFNSSCYYNTFGNSCHDNIFGNSCRTNIFGDYCNLNTFGEECYLNTFGNSCHNNILGDNCASNTFGNDCYYNKLGRYCNSNTFSNDCYSNKLGSESYSNTFGNNCFENTFNYDCNSNTFGKRCNSNTFGSECYFNTLYNDCSFNTFGDGCFSNTFGNNCYNNEFGDECNSNIFGDGCYGNLFIIYCGSNTFGKNCYENTLGEECFSNTFGDDCFSNKLFIDCDYNTFGNGCYSNIFIECCHNNKFSNSCYGNEFGNSCYGNEFGNSCGGNIFGEECDSNEFGNSCYNNEFGNNCDNNEFGNNCCVITFGTDCYGNTFGTDCSNINFGESCCYNSFGNGCSEINFGESCCYNSFGNGCFRIVFSQPNGFIPYLNNIHFGDRVVNIGLVIDISGDSIDHNYNLKNVNVTQGFNSSNEEYVKINMGEYVGITDKEITITKDYEGNVKVFCLADVLVQRGYI